ncbi:MAG: hypothetical protein U5L09_03925 [Bacteroidales bacterium]|nr:hypothetical protein [Bacteroidales bacterium]
MVLRKAALTIISILAMWGVQAQFNPSEAQVHGNFQIDAQTYQEDSKIGLSAAGYRR